MLKPLSSSVNLNSAFEVLQGTRTNRFGTVLAVLASSSIDDLTKQFINHSLPARVLQHFADGSSQLEFTLPDQRTLQVQARLQQQLPIGQEIVLQLTLPSEETALANTANRAELNRLNQLTLNANTLNTIDTSTPNAPSNAASALPRLSQIAVLVGQILGSANRSAPQPLNNLPYPNDTSNSANLPTAIDVASSLKQLSLTQATREIAQQLQQAISQSGLFYEAHLQEWANGERSLAAVRQEPQAQTPVNSVTTTPNEAARTNPLTSDQGDRNLPNVSSISTSSNLALPEKMLPLPPANLIPLVREQLQLLDTRSILTHLQLWPGQMAELQIEEQNRQSGEPNLPALWVANLQLSLPQLGQIQAKLTLHGDTLQLRLTVENDNALQTMQADQQTFHAALLQAGLNISGWQLSSQT